MINIRLARAVFLAMLACLIMLIGAGWSENSGPPSLEETLQSGIAGFAANAEAPSVDELSAAEQEALLQEVMSNLWRYEASPDSPRPMPRATDARNGLIVFVNENGRLSQANPDGSGAIVIQNTIENANSPQWSPDETRIAFVGDKQGSTGRCIYILRHSDRQLSTVTCEPAIIQDPHWSSDGQSLAFFGHMSEGDARKAGWVVSANGGSLKEIAPSLLNIWTPKWIDHDTVVFSGESPADSWRIYRADTDSLESAVPITPVFTCECTAESIVAAQPVLSPDRAWIAFVAARTEGGKSNSLAVAAVYIVDPEGARTPVKLGDITDTSSGTGYYGHMYWAPNNQQIGVLASGSDQMMRLNLLRVDSEDVTTLHSREGGSWSNWDWAPDGRLIASGHQRPEQEWEVNTLFLGSDSFQRLIPGHSPTWRNATEAQCAGADKSKRPIMLVTGWGGSQDNWLSKDDQLKFFINYLDIDNVDDYKEGCNLFYVSGTSPYVNLDDNGRVILDNLCSAYHNVKEFNPGWSGTFDIIGHSYGGLRARHFLENDDIYDGARGGACGDGATVFVENLITLGTPHGGEPYFDELELEEVVPLPLAAFIGICALEPSLCDKEAEGGAQKWALFEMAPPTRLAQNLLNKQPDNTCYHVLAGDARTQINQVPWIMRRVIEMWPRALEDPNDFAVHRASSYVLGSGLLRWNYPRVNKIDTNDIHGYVPEDKWWSGEHNLISYVEPAWTFDNVISDLIAKPCDDFQTMKERSADVDLSAVKTRLRSLVTTVGASQLDIDAGTLTPGQPETGQFVVTEAGNSQVSAYWSAGNLAFTLIDPLGNTITPQSGTPGVTYFDLNVGFGVFANYQLDDMMPGTWGYNLTVTDVESAVAYRLLYRAGRNISINLTAPQWMSAGEPLLLSASLSHNGTRLASGTVIARIERPDTSSAMLDLFDDGAHGDGMADDGVYANTYANTNQGGYYGILITASGEIDTTAYERTTSALVAVAPSTKLTGNYRDEGVDVEGDGYFESLAFEAEVDVAQAGDYLIKAELWAGNQLITESEGWSTLEPGTHWLPIFFDGNDIRKGGFDGPYQIRNMLLIDQTQASILIDTVDEVHQTGSYNHRLFGTLYKAYVPLVKKTP